MFNNKLDNFQGFKIISKNGFYYQSNLINKKIIRILESNFNKKVNLKRLLSLFLPCLMFRS